MFPVRIYSDKVLSMFIWSKKGVKSPLILKALVLFWTTQICDFNKKHFQLFHQGKIQEISSTRWVFSLYLQNKNEFVQFIV